MSQDLTVPQILTACVLVPGLAVGMIALAIAIDRWDRKRIRRHVEAMGGTVLESKSFVEKGKPCCLFTLGDGVVLHGEFAISGGQVHVHEVLPVEEIMRREFGKLWLKSRLKDPQEQFKQLMYFAHASSLPCVRRAQKYVDELIKLDVFEREEFEADYVKSEGPNFGGLIQGLTIMSFTDDDRPHVEMIRMRDKASFNMMWSVGGEKPHRVLRIVFEQSDMPQNNQVHPAREN